MRLKTRASRIHLLERLKDHYEEQLRHRQEALAALAQMPPHALFWTAPAVDWGKLRDITQSPIVRYSDVKEARVYCKVPLEGQTQSFWVTLRLGEPPRTSRDSAHLLLRTPLIPDMPVTRLITETITPHRHRRYKPVQPETRLYLVAQGDHLVCYSDSRFFRAVDIATREQLRQMLVDGIAANEQQLQELNAELEKWRALPEGLYDDSGMRAEPFTGGRVIMGSMGEEYVEALLLPGHRPQILRRVGSGKMPEWCERVYTDLLRAGHGVYEKRNGVIEDVWVPLGIIVGD